MRYMTVLGSRLSTSLSIFPLVFPSTYLLMVSALSVVLVKSTLNPSVKYDCFRVCRNSGFGLKRLSTNTAVPSSASPWDALLALWRSVWKAWSTSVWVRKELLKPRPLKSWRCVSPCAPTDNMAKAVDTELGEKKTFCP
ncbi:hypothetical protein FQN60_007000 [Etheostoma spectabile]|uniref:Uncharacterized protein n=1 Tax=Etheostoma spectabile TaxID=54343 RepID=A0A5J5CBW9_9PERO|nr:hypothetical protein FQN60_007000 [Etheostoma spectabile]